MRDYKFRGKRKDNGEWVYGYYYSFANRHHIHVIEPWPGGASLACYEVDPVTVGEYTGLHDKNGVEIYEGDILKVKTNWKKSKGFEAFSDDGMGCMVKGETYWTVEYKIFGHMMGFMVYGIDRRFNKPITKNTIYGNEAEIVGNIYENPELLAANTLSER